MSVARIGVSLEGRLLEDLDRWIAERGYASRSEGLRQIVREALARSRVSGGDETVGTITYVYRHDVGTVTHKILHRQHDFLGSIRATAHTHLDEEVCLEVLIVQGKAGRIAELSDRLRATRGVLFERTVLTPRDMR